MVGAGEKLSESTAGDVRELCTTLLNCYLIQLLETGFLHADPHPGNLIRTPEGQICILDFGLMTEVSVSALLSIHFHILLARPLMLLTSFRTMAYSSNIESRPARTGWHVQCWADCTMCWVVMKIGWYMPMPASRNGT